jgi:hypothetical protein
LFAGIDIGFAGVAGGVDEKIRLGPSQKLEQVIGTCVVHFTARERFEGISAFVQCADEGLADIAGSAEEQYHPRSSQSRQIRFMKFELVNLLMCPGIFPGSFS